MKPTPEIIILTGNIGSGKSTLCKKYVEKGYVVISRDAIRYMIGSGEYVFNPEYENAVWMSELKILDSFMLLGVNIIVDEVGISKKVRKRYIELADLYGYRKVSIILPKLSKKESVDRRMKNPHGTPNREEWEDVWEKFNSKYEEPSKEEGFDEIRKML